MTFGKKDSPLIINIFNHLSKLDILTQADLTFMAQIGGGRGTEAKTGGKAKMGIDGYLEGGFHYTIDVLKNIKELFREFQANFLADYIINEQLDSKEENK